MRLPPLEQEARDFLYVGPRSTCESSSFLLRALADAASSCRTIQSHIAGSPLTEDEGWQIQRLGVEDNISVQVFPDEEALKNLYRRSVALLYPSIHEGFGDPPLEARSRGTIPVTSHTTSLPEITGDAGFMLDPHDQAMWTECILALARGTVDRDTVLKRGYAQVARFTWEKTARDHFDLYQRFATP